MPPQLNPVSVAARLKKLCPLRPTPTWALVLGSGFQDVPRAATVVKRIPYAQLPGWPRTTVPGHTGELLFARLGGVPVLILSGRSHFYEGEPMERVTFAVRVIAAFGIRDLLLTNAAGAIAPGLRPGDFMVVTDHINLMGANPLRGRPISRLSRFVDLTDTYSGRLRQLLKRAASRAGIRWRTGVYLAVSGPSYETPAEIRAFARLGADAVGMSTVPEAIVARQCGLNVAAISCLTNFAAGRSRRPLSHAEVLETGERVKAQAARWLKTFAELYERGA